MKTSPSAARLLVVLRDEVRTRSFSNEALAHQINRCSRSVNRAIVELIDAGLITVTYTRAHGPGEVARRIDVVVPEPARAPAGDGDTVAP